MPLLARRFRVLAMDLPGHGFTARRNGETLSLEAMSVAVAELLETLGAEPAIVIGHSAGAAITLQMSLDGVLNARTLVGVNAALHPFGGAWQPLIRPVTRALAGAAWVPKLLARRAREADSVRRMLESTGFDPRRHRIALLPGN